MADCSGQEFNLQLRNRGYRSALLQHLDLFELEPMGTEGLCKVRCLQNTAFRKAKWADKSPLEYVSPRSDRILSKLWATQFTSYLGQMFCIAQETQVIWIHLPFRNEDRSSSFFSCHVLHLSCLSKTYNFPEFSTKFTTKLPAAGPGQSCNIRNNGDLAALGVTLKDISHLAKCLWFILSSTNCIKTLD